MNDQINLKLVDHLVSFLSEERNNKFDEVLQNRTRHITIVCEDLYQSHNASAVIRSCEIFGIQDIHILEGKNEFSANNEVSVGSASWIDLHKYGSNAEHDIPYCYEKLRRNGYTIIATSPGSDSIELESLDVDNKIALLLGTEETGLSDHAIENSDITVKIPMYGFTESFNVSVACSLLLQELTKKLQKSKNEWRLSDEEQLEIKYSWLLKSVKNSDLIVKRFLEETKST